MLKLHSEIAYDMDALPNTTLKHAIDADFMAEEAPEMQKCILANRKAVKYLKKSGNFLKLDHAVQPFYLPRFNSLLTNLKSTFDQFRDVVRVLNESGCYEHYDFTLFQNEVDFDENL